MTIHVSAEGRNAQLNALLELASGAYITISTGVQPASPEDGSTGEVLAELALNSPAFNPASDGAADLNVSTPIAGVAAGDGVATWARIWDFNGTPLMDGNVGTTSMHDFVINSASITADQPISILGGTLSLPA